MLEKVPLDVQLIVVGWVYRLSQHASIDYPTLRACALVCKAWTPIAQRLLFRRVPFPISKPWATKTLPITRLLRTFRAEPRLAAHVRTFTKLLRYFDGYYEEEELEALALCTNVQGVVFLGELAIIPHSNLVTRLGALRIRPIFISFSGDKSLINRVMQNWPSVRALEVIPSRRTESADVQVQMPWTLQALSTRPSDLPSYWPAPGTVPPELHDLEIKCWVPADAVHLTGAAVIASGVLAQLRTLRIVGGFADVFPAAVLEQLTVLESLVIEHLPTLDKFELPRNLRHLGYHSNGDSEQRGQVQILLDAVRARPELKLLTATRHSSQAVLKQLEDVCRTGDVEFAVYAEPACFPHARHVDWI
ncbi:hypothetical protein FA95DRAFT_1607689 [Auriscalpium vulgare]|uniref:Uncharacterized protein n=1 Tax=Auriscalpium vulgare TaxID=40419 RepID=A0ACB8RMI0_9AGAM|nr:hypothetical protein FA95DRAFT_1607689 [Auriscalpium vulgare]